MVVAIVVVVALVVVALIVLSMSLKVVTQYERGVHFRLGKILGTKDPGLRVILPVLDQLRKVSLRIVTMPIQSQGIITRDNVSVDIAAVAYYKVIDPVKSIVAIENVSAAINQIAQTTLRKVVGKHTLDETLSETEEINADIRAILEVTAEEWGVEVTLVELKDIQLPEGMKRAMAKQAEAEREKRAKIIAAEGESMAATALGEASDVMMAHPLALQLRNLQTLLDIAVDKNSTVVFPSPLMSTIAELGSFLAREAAAAETRPEPNGDAPIPTVTERGRHEGRSRRQAHHPWPHRRPEGAPRHHRRGPRRGRRAALCRALGRRSWGDAPGPLVLPRLGRRHRSPVRGSVLRRHLESVAPGVLAHPGLSAVVRTLTMGEGRRTHTIVFAGRDR